MFWGIKPRPGWDGQISLDGPKPNYDDVILATSRPGGTCGRASHSPQQSPFVERLIGSIRREFLDNFLVLNKGHLRRIPTRYLAIPPPTLSNRHSLSARPSGRPPRPRLLVLLERTLDPTTASKDNCVRLTENASHGKINYAYLCRETEGNSARR